jgi:pimeloyl-ACP methyl ester carboxylesterase
MDAETGRARVGDGCLYFERAGEGFPVVLIHPGLWDSRIWDDQFEAFARYHDVVRYDLRGHGRSDGPRGPYSDVRDLGRLLGELGIERCALVGCSEGARIAIDFALEHPEAVDAIVSVAPELSGYAWEDAGLELLRAEVDRALASGDLEAAVDVQLAVWAPMRTDPKTDARIRQIAVDNAHLLRERETFAERPSSAVDRLRDLEAATLVIVGHRDIEEIHTMSDLIVESVPGAHKHVVADADQLVNVRRPDRFNRLVLDFLSFRT